MIKKYFKITEKTKWILYIFISILVVLGVLNLIIPVNSSKISVMADYMFSFMHNLVLIICMLIFFIKTYVIFGVF